MLCADQLSTVNAQAWEISASWAMGLGTSRTIPTTPACRWKCWADCHSQLSAPALNTRVDWSHLARRGVGVSKLEGSMNTAAIIA